ncbi:hypothetical protein [Streptomyces sp. 2P-4]|uniref:hypothetical protein n=1 Tax=Streptomyces sp. 2P-4 TaxID=2931974 RepID=UPI00254206E1|nr:hypothetical protein [Streptomyces sp. 2P-4]
MPVQSAHLAEPGMPESASGEPVPAPVFVDQSGLRGRVLRGFGWPVSIVGAVLAVAMGSSLIGVQADAPAMVVPVQPSRPAAPAPAPSVTQARAPAPSSAASPRAAMRSATPRASASGAPPKTAAASRTADAPPRPANATPRGAKPPGRPTQQP